MQHIEKGPREDEETPQSFKGQDGSQYVEEDKEGTQPFDGDSQPSSGDEGDPNVATDDKRMEHADRAVRARPVAMHACCGSDALCICCANTTCRVRAALR